MSFDPKLGGHPILKNIVGFKRTEESSSSGSKNTKSKKNDSHFIDDKKHLPNNNAFTIYNNKKCQFNSFDSKRINLIEKQYSNNGYESNQDYYLNKQEYIINNIGNKKTDIIHNRNKIDENSTRTITINIDPKMGKTDHMHVSSDSEIERKDDKFVSDEIGDEIGFEPSPEDPVEQTIDDPDKKTGTPTPMVDPEPDPWASESDPWAEENDYEDALYAQLIRAGIEISSTHIQTINSMVEEFSRKNIFGR